MRVITTPIVAAPVVEYAETAAVVAVMDAPPAVKPTLTIPEDLRSVVERINEIGGFTPAVAASLRFDTSANMLAYLNGQTLMRINVNSFPMCCGVKAMGEFDDYRYPLGKLDNREGKALLFKALLLTRAAQHTEGFLFGTVTHSQSGSRQMLQDVGAILVSTFNNPNTNHTIDVFCYKLRR